MSSTPTNFAWSKVSPTSMSSALESLSHQRLPNLATRQLGIPRMRASLERFIQHRDSYPSISASIADVHGNVQGLRRELTYLRQQKIENVICTGDLVDRDPHSMAVIRELRLAQAQFSLHVLLGNHDLFFLRAVNGSFEDLKVWLGNGGLSVLNEEEVGLTHWMRLARNEAGQLGVTPAVWVRSVLCHDSETLQRIMKQVQSNDTLNEAAQWMRGNMVLSYLSELGLLYVHAGIPTDARGCQTLRFKVDKATYSGLWALAKAEELLFKALDEKSSHDPVYDFLESAESPLWIRNWDDSVRSDEEKAQQLLDSLGVSGIVVGHTVQSRIQSVHDGCIIFADRGLAEAYKGQPGVVVAGAEHGIRCVTTFNRELCEPKIFTSRIARAREAAKRVLADLPPHSQN